MIYLLIYLGGIVVAAFTIKWTKRLLNLNPIKSGELVVFLVFWPLFLAALTIVGIGTLLEKITPVLWWKFLNWVNK